MSSVTQTIRKIEQPYGGYLRPSRFEITQFDDGIELNLDENINPGLVSSAVDYLTRVQMGSNVETAFSISLKGANNIGKSNEARAFIDELKGLDDQSIINASKLVGYDICYRKGPMFYKPVEEINPNRDTIENIRTMVRRCMFLFEEHGPITLDGFTFIGGYTEVVTSGDGDFLTERTLWDLKVSKNKPNKNHTLQLLLYYLMGLRSIHKIKFERLESIGFFNPRFNQTHILEIENISKDLMDTISSKVIGYSD